MIIEKVSGYKKNGYMQGQCRNCKEWEAPITVEELSSMQEPYAHHGSTRKQRDKSTRYHRMTWEECFQCPKCSNKFRVGFSST